MNKYFVIFVAFILISILVFSVYLFTRPQVISDRLIISTNSNSSSLQDKKTIKQGSFVEVDAVHKGSGSVQIIQNGAEYALSFGKDFTVANGPDLYIWLVKEQKLGGAVGGVNTDSSSYVELGKLARYDGVQDYKIAKSELDNFNYAVVIWCKAFNVQFTHAILQ
jgi:Electron transfer DM13